MARSSGKDAKGRIRNWARRVGLVLLLAFLGAQFFQPSRTNPPIRSEVAAPDAVRSILRAACYDCHSNETRWRWYHRVAPVSWYTVRHVHRGRADLNFSEWPAFDIEAQEELFAEIREELREDEMPLDSYRLVHPAARLSEVERRRLIRWAGGEEM